MSSRTSASLSRETSCCSRYSWGQTSPSRGPCQSLATSPTLSIPLRLPGLAGVRILRRRPPLLRKKQHTKKNTHRPGGRKNVKSVTPVNSKENIGRPFHIPWSSDKQRRNTHRSSNERTERTRFRWCTTTTTSTATATATSIATQNKKTRKQSKGGRCATPTRRTFNSPLRPLVTESVRAKKGSARVSTSWRRPCLQRWTAVQLPRRFQCVAGLF